MARENIGCKVQDEFFGQNKAVFLIRQGNIFREYRTAARNDSDFFAAFFLQYNNRINFLVLQEWERLLFADDLRREQRFDFRAKIRLQIIRFLLRNGVEVYNLHALGFQAVL